MPDRNAQSLKPVLPRVLGFASMVVLATLALPSSASAYEDQVVISIDLGYAAALVNDDLPTHGLIAGFGVDVGIGDAWAIRSRLSYAYHPATEPLHAPILGVEVVYLLDILEFVPFFGIGIDGIGTVFEGDFGLDIAAHVVVGIDWLLARKWLVGLEVRPYFLPFSLADTGLDPVYITAGVKMGIVIDRY